MPDNLRAVLDEMDNWIAECGTDNFGTVTEEEVNRWRGAFATTLERLDKLGQASRSVVDAYLLRPSPSALPPSPSTKSTASSRQKHMRRFALAMATLERELASTLGEEDASRRLDPPLESGA
jgi:hypothetical protein